MPSGPASLEAARLTIDTAGLQAKLLTLGDQARPAALALAPVLARQDPAAAARHGRILGAVPAAAAGAREVLGDGRRGLRAGVRRRLRATGADAAGVRAPVIVQNLIGGLAALALIVYLFVALIRPEKF